MLEIILLKEIKRALKNESKFVYDSKFIYSNSISYTFYLNKNSLEALQLDVIFDRNQNLVLVEVSNISNDLIYNTYYNLDFSILDNFNNDLVYLKQF